MTRHIGAAAVCIFMLGMMTGYLLSSPAPAAAQVKAQTISPEAITKTVSGLKDETVLNAI